VRVLEIFRKFLLILISEGFQIYYSFNVKKDSFIYNYLKEKEDEQNKKE
jgi:hypothetical protein